MRFLHLIITWLRDLLVHLKGNVNGYLKEIAADKEYSSVREAMVVQEMGTYRVQPMLGAA